eukprot:234190-Rhodomonas_salina.1
MVSVQRVRPTDTKLRKGNGVLGAERSYCPLVPGPIPGYLAGPTSIAMTLQGGSRLRALQS